MSPLLQGCARGLGGALLLGILANPGRGTAESPPSTEVQATDSGPVVEATGAADAGSPPAAFEASPDAGKRLAPVEPILTYGTKERGWWWDLNLEGAVGLWVQPHDPVLGMGRIRGGALYMAEPWYFTMGATYEFSNLSPAAFGAQVEALNLWSGFWGEAGAEVNIAGQVGPNFSVGYSLVGVESETWVGGSKPARTAVLVKLQVPVSWLLRIGKPARLPTAPP